MGLFLFVRWTTERGLKKNMAQRKNLRDSLIKHKF